MQINKEQNIKEETKNTKKIYQEIIRKNLKKYIVSKNRYNRYIINHLIFIRKKTIVSRFKDHLIMDDVGEYLKRFLKEPDKWQCLTNPLILRIMIKNTWMNE